MFWTALLAVCAFVCISISFVLQNKNKSAKPSVERQKIYIEECSKICDNLYEFSAYSDNGRIDFYNKIPFPVGSYLEAEIHNDQITIYSENVQQNQLFRVLSLIEKWRYSGTVFLLAAMATALAQSKQPTTMVTGFCIIIVMAITMFIVVRSKNRYYEYCQEESNGNIISVPYELIATEKNTAYITYTNQDDQRLVAAIPKRILKRNPKHLNYHIISKSIILASKKLIRITNIVSLICASVFAIAIAILSVLSL